MNAEKVLFISDLDGTLLNSSCEISDVSKEIINRLAKQQGLRFTVSTARTSETVRLLTEGLSINAPAVLMNGVALYDLAERNFISFEEIPQGSKEKLFDIIKRYGSWGFAYVVKNNLLETYYVNCHTPNSYDFMRERIEKFNKKFTRVENFSQICGESCIYFSVSHREEFLKPIFEELKNVEGLSIEYYRDIYNTDFRYLEVCSTSASKYHSAIKLKQLSGASRVIAFGDNLNDLPLFRAADECYAVENAVSEVKAAADGVIPSNNSDGVAKFIEEYFKKNFT